MTNIPHLPGTSQEVLFAFDFQAKISHVFIILNNRLVEAVASRKPFDGLMRFAWSEDENNPDREVKDLELVCEFSVDQGLRIEILPELLELMVKVDPSTIIFTIKGKPRSPFEPIRWGDIGFILVYALLQDNCSAVMKDGKYYIHVSGGSDPKALPEDQSQDGITSPEPEPTFIPGRKKGHLTVVEAKPEPERKPKKGGPPPKDVMRYAGKMDLRESWKPVVKQLYKRSDPRKLKDVPHYPRATKRRGRYYFCGINYLAQMSGVTILTVVRVLKDLLKAKLIYERYHGYKGRGCSIIELPPNMGLVMKWRREHES